MSSINPYILLQFVIMAVVIIVVVRILFKNFQKRMNVWGAVATELGLRYERGNHFWSTAVVAGRYRDHEMKLDVYKTSNGKNSETFTRLIMQLNSASGIRLHLYEEMITGRISKRFGAQDIQIGDDAFDRRFMIKGEPEDTVRNYFMESTLREILLSVPSLDIRVDGNEVLYVKRGLIGDPAYLRSVIDVVAAVSENVDHGSRGPERSSSLTPRPAPEAAYGDPFRRQVLTPQQIVDRYAQQKRMQKIGGGVLTAFFIILVIARVMTNPLPPRWDEIEWYILGTVAFAAYTLFIYLTSRCPVCKAYIGTAGEEKSCPKCGVKLE